MYETTIWNENLFWKSDQTESDTFNMSQSDMVKFQQKWLWQSQT